MCDLCFYVLILNTPFKLHPVPLFMILLIMLHTHITMSVQRYYQTGAQADYGSLANMSKPPVYQSGLYGVSY